MFLRKEKMSAQENACGNSNEYCFIISIFLGFSHFGFCCGLASAHFIEADNAGIDAALF